MDPTNFVNNAQINMRGIKAWLESEDLKQVILEIFNPILERTDPQMDIDVRYSWLAGDGNFWTDTDQLRCAIRKASIAPSTAKYDLLLRTNPDVQMLQDGRLLPCAPRKIWFAKALV